MSKKEVSIVLVGIGGYGNVYVDGLLENQPDENFKIVGIVDPIPEGNRRLSELKEMGIPFFNNINDFYEKFSADLAIISSPIQFHCPQTCQALAHGSNVLCEKPITTTIQNARKMIEARDKSGKFLAIGYQWSFSDAILELKRDIRKGVFGKPEVFKTLILWPRNFAYYSRNNWAGKIRDDKGNWILDSVANNATAHYLHNMFFVLGEEMDSSASPASIKAELYRANNIENYDTAVIQAVTENDVRLLYYASHAVDKEYGPVFDYQFEKANVKFTGQDIVATFNDGHKKNYGDPFQNNIKKLWTAIQAVRGDAKITCRPETALSHLITINSIQESGPIIDFPQNLVKNKKYDKSTLIYVENLFQILSKCYQDEVMPSEVNIDWAEVSSEFNLAGYNCFNGSVD